MNIYPFLYGGKMFIEVSDNLKKLSKFFPENLYIVGGYVRNKILKIEDSDVDLASSVNIEEVSKRLNGSDFSVKIKNLKFGSILISCKDESYEYTAFRKEIYPDDGSHCPSQVISTDKLEEDAIRRDFTFNSIYYNINKDEIVDIYHGIFDLSDRVIKCNINPDEVFTNDGERILRMVRFAGELNFKIDKNTLKSAIKYASNVKDIQGCRKLVELEKILYCDKRYYIYQKGGLRRALELLNLLGIWKYFGLKSKKIKYKMVYKVDDRLLGLLIDIVNTEKPECLETFLDEFLKTQLGINQTNAKKILIYLSGYYDALCGMKNKDYFFKYYQDWACIYMLLGKRSKRIQNRYHFFYQYIIEHGLVIAVSDLAINANDIKDNFPNIDKRQYDRILENLLSKVFDGKVKNDKNSLLEEIRKNLQNY